MSVESPESRVESGEPETGCCRTPPFCLRRSALGARRFSAFTLIELLVVISILGILAALAVPALKNLGKSNTAISANAQLLGDVGYARQLALSQRTTVYMVFLPPNFWDNTVYINNYAAWWKSLTQAQQSAVTNLCDKQLTGYAFIAKGAVGDQPGNHQWHYLAPWRALPDGTFIAQWKFTPLGPLPAMVISNPVPVQGFNVYGFATNQFPFPTADVTNKLWLPCIAFNYLGQLTSDGQNLASRDEYIPLSHGTVLAGIDPVTRALVVPFPPPPGSPSVSEAPPGNSTNSSFNLVDIDALTGRATLRFQKAQ